jgi:FKBP-type peptidyl-prolyl cis-trans isomerase (trigger factor)
MLTVGKSALPDFDNNLLGMTVGETREFDIVVPPNGLPSMAGKLVHLKATLSMGSKTAPCPLDDTLAIKVGKQNITELREFVTATAVGRIAHAHQLRINEAVANRLIVDNKLDVPGWLTLSEAQYLVHQAKLEWSSLPDSDREKYLELGEKNVKLALVLDKIREVEASAQLTDQEVFDIIKKNLANTKVQTSLDDIIKEMNRTGQLQILFSRVRDEHALDFVVKHIKLIE